MLDLQFIRDQAQMVRTACEQKQLSPGLVDELLAVDQQRRQLLAQVEDLRHQSHLNATTVKQQVHDGGRPNSELIDTGQKLKRQLKNLDPQLQVLTDQLDQL